jgi:hypothetical protein
MTLAGTARLAALLLGTMIVSGCGGAAGDSGTQASEALAARLNRPARFQIGLGSTAVADIQSQGIAPDIYDRYLVGVGSGSWTGWNSPPGSYVGKVASDAASIGAIPMYTLYQMASNGDGNLSGLDDASFMREYWNNVTLLFQQLGSYGKPAIVNFEPDFWGYAQRQAPGGDPARLPAQVRIDPDCADLTDDVVGVAGCLLRSARKYAPKVATGFPVSAWGAGSTGSVVAFMNAIGASQADMIIMSTLDRDAGCFESAPQPADCQRSSAGLYWDETNKTRPNFQEHLATVRAYHDGIGGLPVLWWQTPLGVPSAVTGGSVQHYRDNRVHYFLTHAPELVAAGGFGAVFGAGDGNQTEITTDGGQFQRLSRAYLESPAEF